MKLLVLGDLAGDTEHVSRICRILEENEQIVIACIIEQPEQALEAVRSNLNCDAIIVIVNSLMEDFPCLSIFTVRPRPKLILIVVSNEVASVTEDPLSVCERAGADQALYYNSSLESCLVSTVKGVLERHRESCPPNNKVQSKNSGFLSRGYSGSQSQGENRLPTRPKKDAPPRRKERISFPYCGEKFSLPIRLFEIFDYLIERPGETITRERLVEDLRTFHPNLACDLSLIRGELKKKLPGVIVKGCFTYNKSAEGEERVCYHSPLELEQEELAY